MIASINFRIYLNELIINITHSYPDPAIMTRQTAFGNDRNITNGKTKEFDVQESSMSK